MFYFLFFLFLGVQSSIVHPIQEEEDGKVYEVFNMKDRDAEVLINASDYEDARNFCYNGTGPELFKFWASATFKIDIFSNDITVYLGNNVSHAHMLHSLSETAWFYWQLPWKQKTYKVHPFQKSCVRVLTSHEYKIGLQVLNINYFQFFTTLFCILIYFLAPRLCRNQFFHFTTGISLGIFFSFILLTFLLQKRLKIQFMSWITLFYSLSLYFLTSTWFNIKEYLTTQYLPWLVGYVLASGLISFAVIYRLGPPDNPRTINLIQWSMQGMCLLGIYFSSYHQQMSISFVIMLLVWRSIPNAIKSSANTRFRRTFLKPKVRLLTEEEYSSQSAEATRKAIEDLRRYCKSPESKPWLTVTKLSSPGRFAEFVEGSPHITQDEVMEFSHWDSNDDNTDDESGSRSTLTDDDDQ